MKNRLADVWNGARTWVMAATLGALTLSGSQARATDTLAPLTISALHGDVQVSSLGAPLKATIGATLPLPASVRTGADGSIELRQGETVVSAAANAQLDIPVSGDPAATLDRIIQKSGNVYYSVAKRTSSKLHVETRYLVAVIKGTQFNVSVNAAGSTLSLLEGLVELRSANGSDVMNISAGQIGTISADQPRIRVLSMTSGETIRAGVVAPARGRQATESPTPVGSNTGSDAKPAAAVSALVAGSPLPASSSSTSAPSVLASNVASANAAVPASAAASNAVGALQSLTTRVSPASGSTKASSDAGGNSGTSNVGGSGGTAGAGGNSADASAGISTGTSNASANSGNANAGGNSGSPNAGSNGGTSNVGSNSGGSNAGSNSGTSNAGGSSGNTGGSNASNSGPSNAGGSGNPNASGNANSDITGTDNEDNGKSKDKNKNKDKDKDKDKGKSADDVIQNLKNLVDNAKGHGKGK